MKNIFKYFIRTLLGTNRVFIYTKHATFGVCSHNLKMHEIDWLIEWFLFDEDCGTHLDQSSSQFRFEAFQN